MKVFVVIFSLCVAAHALPQLNGNQEGHVSVTQSTAGTYKYTVNLKDLLKTEERLADGTVIGEYTLLDEQGMPLKFKYTAGIDGFRIEGPLTVAASLYLGPPTPVTDTPEVQAAKAVFFAEYQKELAKQAEAGADI